MTRAEQAQVEILDALKYHFDRTPESLDVSEVVEVTAWDEDTVYNALRVLCDSRRIKGITVAGRPYPVRITGVVYD